MAIVRMKKIRLIAMQSQKEALLSRMMHVGCVQILEQKAKLTDPEWAALLSKDISSLPKFKVQLNSLNAALEALAKYAPVKTFLFEKRSDISEADFFDNARRDHALQVAETINGAVREISGICSTQTRLHSQQESLIPWASLPLPLEQTCTDTTSILRGSCPASVPQQVLEQALQQAAPMASLEQVFADREQAYYLLVVHKEAEASAVEALRRHGFLPIRFKDMMGTAQENIDALQEELQALDAQRQVQVDQIVACKGEREALRLCADRTQQELQKQRAQECLLTDGTIVFLEGWVSVNGLEALKQELNAFDCAYAFTDPDNPEEVPVLLKNSRLVDPMHMVTEMYQLPTYDGIDPNPLIFPFFVFFYGMMFADIGYGLIMTIVSLVILKKYRPKGTMGYMFAMGVQIGIMTTICGVLTGTFFGDAITVISESFLGRTGVALWALINPLEDPMTILIIAIVLGAVHMLFGQCVHMYMGARDGKLSGFLDAALDVIPWWTLFAGIAMLVLNGSTVLLIVGVIFLVATQGRHKHSFLGKLFGGITSLYDITSWLGDILSYARLMALMLATTVIASVVNILGALPGSIFAFIPIFLFGHLFNLGINVIGTYVHAARLQYLEFFGKFYKGGGSPFQPLRYDTKYVDIVQEQKEV